GGLPPSRKCYSPAIRGRADASILQPRTATRHSASRSPHGVKMRHEPNGDVLDHAVSRQQRWSRRGFLQLCSAAAVALVLADRAPETGEVATKQPPDRLARIPALMETTEVAAPRPYEDTRLLESIRA